MNLIYYCKTIIKYHFAMKINFFKVMHGVFLLIELLFIVMAILGIIFLTSRDDNPDFKLSNLKLLPSDSNLLNHYQGINLTLKNFPNENVSLMVTETAIRIEDTQLFFFPLLLIVLVFLAIGLLILDMMRRMIKSVEKGDPFIIKNVMRINILGTVFMLVPLSARVMFYGLDQWIKSNIEFTGLELQKSSISELPWYLGGFLLLAIGRVFLEGIKLKEEQSLTI